MSAEDDSGNGGGTDATTVVEINVGDDATGGPESSPVVVAESGVDPADSVDVHTSVRVDELVRENAELSARLSEAERVAHAADQHAEEAGQLAVAAVDLAIATSEEVQAVEEVVVDDPDTSEVEATEIEPVEPDEPPNRTHAWFKHRGSR